MITPEIQNVQISVYPVTAVDDWRYDLLMVESVGVANIVCKIHVSTASGTVGATAKLGIRVGDA